jgi:hypothetical protein
MESDISLTFHNSFRKTKTNYYVMMNYEVIRIIGKGTFGEVA